MGSSHHTRLPAFSNKIKKLYKMNSLDKVTTDDILLPSVLYGILIWGNAADHLINDIERIHIKAARFVERISKSIPDLKYSCRKLETNKLLLQVACKTYKIYNISSTPSEIYFKVVKIFPICSIQKIICLQSCHCRNNITTSIREKSSVDCFKLALSRSNDIGFWTKFNLELVTLKTTYITKYLHIIDNFIVSFENRARFWSSSVLAF